MASHGPGQGVDRRRGLKSGITRARTGCLTCRKRRKKCDERRPTCFNCEKTNVHCEGYPQAVIWESRTAARRRSSTRNTLPSVAPSGTNSPVQPVETFFLGSEAWAGNTVYSPTVQASAYFPNGETTDNDIDPNFNFLFNQFGVPSVFEGQSTQSHVPELDNGYEDHQPLDAMQQRRHQQQPSSHILQQRVSLPIGLPFPISGVDTPTHRRLFCHLTSVMGSILTTFAADNNPFNAVMIPLALGDRMVMNTLLSLAGSHLLKAQNWSSPDADLVRERARLHDGAVQMQSSRIHSIKQHLSNPPQSIQHHEELLATSLLLCLYEICEGSGDNAWRNHLDMARQVIDLASKPSNATTQSRTLTTDLNPFLLEFFVYHDSLATVTVPSTSVSKLHFDTLDALPVQSSSLVGVQDGLIDFIERISILRKEAEDSTSYPDGNIICKGMSIWTDLNEWKPNPDWTKPRQLITTFYQYALFIWLFSIMRPDGKADPTVQDAVHIITIGMADIKPGDGVMACLLFPLFIVATAAITPEDRDTISAHFKRLRAWSSLGNIDLTFKIVQKIWKDHDENVTGSWDWVKQLQDHNLSFMVT